MIHADRFRDHAPFSGDRLGGVLDFHFACGDDLFFDLALTANDCCALPDGALDGSMAAIAR